METFTALLSSPRPPARVREPCGDPLLRSSARRRRAERRIADRIRPSTAHARETQEPTNQRVTSVRSAPAMPPRKPRILRRLVMRSPEEHRVQALDLHPKLAGGPWRKHEQSVLQLVPGPTLAAAGAGELRLPLPPPAPRAVDAHGPHAPRHRHDARRQSLPFEHTDSSVRRSRQTWDIPIPHAWSTPAAFPRPNRSWCSTRHGPFGCKSWTASSHSPRSAGQNLMRAGVSGCSPRRWRGQCAGNFPRPAAQSLRAPSRACTTGSGPSTPPPGR